MIGTATSRGARRDRHPLSLTSGFLLLGVIIILNMRICTLSSGLRDLHETVGALEDEHGALIAECESLRGDLFDALEQCSESLGYQDRLLREPARETP